MCDQQNARVTRGVRAGVGQCLEPVVAIDLQHAPEPGQMFNGALVSAVIRVDVGCYWMARAAPGPVALAKKAARSSISWASRA